MAGHTCPQSGVIGVSRGISKYIYYISRGLLRLGEDVTLLVRDDYRPSESWIKTISAPKFSWMAYPFFLYRHAVTSKADVYYADYPTTGAPFAIAKKRPLVVGVHDAIPWMWNKKEEMLMKDRIADIWIKKCFYVIKNADIILVLSNVARSDILNHTKLQDEQVKVVYCGVDQDFYKPITREPNEKIRIGFFGGLDGRKNAELLVKSFARLAAKRADIELHVAGGGRNFKVFKSMNIQNAYFQGTIQDEKIVEFINSLDIFVYPTLAEGFGLPPLEAMACGVPVITSNATAMPEIIGKYGMLTEPNVDAMCEAIEKLVDDENLRNKYKNLALERASQLSWENAAKQAQKVLQDVINKGG